MMQSPISRRLFLGALTFLAVQPALADEHPSVNFMKRLGEDLLHAHRLGTASAVLRVVARYADLPQISDDLIGQHEIPDGEQSHYRQGVAKYIARYIATQGPTYPVAKFEIGEATVDHDKNVVVESKIYLMAGQVHNVSWKLRWNGSTYKVADAKVLGFSLINWERRHFSEYISSKGGDVNELIAALNRQ